MRFDAQGNLLLAEVAAEAMRPKRAKVTLADHGTGATGAAVTLAEAASLLALSTEDAARLLTEHDVPRHACWDARAVHALAAQRQEAAA